MLSEREKLILEEKISAAKALASLEKGIDFKSAVFIPIMPAYEVPQDDAGKKNSNADSDDINFTKPSEELIHEGVKLRDILRSQERKEDPAYIKRRKKNKKNKKGKKSQNSSLYPALIYLDSGGEGDRNKGHTFSDIKESINKGDFEIIISAHGSPNKIGTLAGSVAEAPKDLTYQLGAIFSMLEIDKSMPITFNFNACNNATVDYRFAVGPALDDDLSKEEKKSIIEGRNEFDIYKALRQKEKDRFFIERSFIGKFATGLVDNGFENAKIKGSRGYIKSIDGDTQRISFTRDDKAESQSELALLEHMEHVITIKDKQVISVDYPLDSALASKSVQDSFEMFEDNYDEINIVQYEGVEEQKTDDNNQYQSTSEEEVQELSPRYTFSSFFESDSEDEHEEFIHQNRFSTNCESDSEDESEKLTTQNAFSSFSESDARGESHESSAKPDISEEVTKQKSSSARQSTSAHSLSNLGTPLNAVDVAKVERMKQRGNILKKTTKKDKSNFRSPNL